MIVLQVIFGYKTPELAKKRVRQTLTVSLSGNYDFGEFDALCTTLDEAVRDYARADLNPQLRAANPRVWIHVDRHDGVGDSGEKAAMSIVELILEAWAATHP